MQSNTWAQFPVSTRAQFSVSTRAQFPVSTPAKPPDLLPAPNTAARIQRRDIPRIRSLDGAVPTRNRTLDGVVHRVPGR